MRLVDADHLVSLVNDATILGDGFKHAFTAIVNGEPTIEPERKKGEWIKAKNWGIRCYQCDQCGNYLDFDGVNAGRGDANFCPNCGADMREE